MKQLFAIAIVAFLCNKSEAQLANTKWTGDILAGDNTLSVLSTFTADTSFFYNNDNNDLLETSTYTINDSTVTFKKVTGQTQCGDEEGKYKFEIKDKQLKLFLINDPCQDRSGALDKAVFTIKEN